MCFQVVAQYRLFRIDMSEHITASPLTWPDGWKRTRLPVTSQFANHSISKATKFIIDELGRMGIRDWNVIISTDLRLRNDGLPYSSQREPDDKGAAVWWKDGKDQRVIALDKYNKISDNLYAIGKTIEAMRGIKRWGGSEILDRTFTGFTSLPSPDHVAARSWRDVLDYYGDDLQEANKAFKIARSKAHDDKGGNTDLFYKVNQAWAEAEKELN